MIGREIELSRPLSLRHTLGPLQQGKWDPSVQWNGSVMWRASRTPDGPVVTRAEMVGDVFGYRCWGNGAQWAAERAQDLIGEGQDGSSFDHELLDDLMHRLPGIRIPKTHAVFEASVWTVIAQRVTSMEAVGSWRKLLWHFHDPAPRVEGAPRLLLPPTPTQIAGLASWQWHRMGVERKRADALRLLGRCAKRIEETIGMIGPDAIRRLTSIPGLGNWSALEIAQVALGDVDAFSLGDYHLKNQVGFALAGRQRSTDEEMAELLAPFRPRRGLAARLIVCGYPRPQAYGPRYSPIGIAAL